MQGDVQSNRKVVIDIVLNSLLLLFIIVALFVFKENNNKRITQQNEDYVKTITVQEAAQIGDAFSSSQSNIETMAYLYGEALDSPEADVQKLKEMQERSSFDYIEYTDADGKNINAEKQTSEAVDRQYYIEGMKGYIGCEIIFNSRITHETLMRFYAPVYYEGEIIGVLNGTYGEAGIKSILSNKIFDTQANAYLCMQDGTVIISSVEDGVSENIFNLLSDTMDISKEVYEEIEHAFQAQESYIFQYAGSQGTSNAYITTIPESEWMLIQTFPSSVTSSMINNANDAGIRLEIQLIIAFGIYIACLLWIKWMQKKKLVAEKKEAARIVDGLSELYRCFVVIDLNEDTYKYLKNVEEGVPTEGKYSELVDYFTQRYIRETEGEDLSYILTRDYIQEHLKKDMPYLQCEYRLQHKNHNREHMSILCLEWEEGTARVVLLAVQDITPPNENEIYSRIAYEKH